MKKELTLKQAMDQGYTVCGLEGKEWQSVIELHDDVFNSDIDKEDWGNIVLFEKKPSFPSVNSRTIADLLADNIAENDSCNSGRDGDEVYDAVMAIDFSATEALVNKKLEEFKYWKATGVKLTNNK